MVIQVIKTFLYTSSVYSCHLLISSASVKSIPFLSFIVPIFASNVPLVSLIFFKGSLLLLLLLSRFSHVRLCATPQTAAHQAPLSRRFSRQEHWSGLHFLLQCRKVKSESDVAQSCPTLSDPMDCSPPGSSVHGIFQARVVEWVAIAFTLFLYIVHLRLSYLSLLFFETLNSDGYIVPFLLCLSLLFSAVCKASSDNHFAFFHFFFLEMVLITASFIVL